MRIAVLNGNPDPENSAFDGHLAALAGTLRQTQHVVKVLQLRDMDIRYCTDCWGCWVKTPGECVARDDSDEVCRAVIQADLALWASPVSMGFYSAVLKKATDKLIPLIHPYVDVVQSEAHHFRRYSGYPQLALLLEKGADSDDEDMRIISEIHRRTALNLRTKMAFTKLTTEPVEEVARAIDRL